jgi:hypothetical protein
MREEENIRPISEAAYREQRSYIADHAFLAVPGGGRPPNDVLGEESWENLTRLPTDVLLRTTDYFGRMISDMQTQASAWLVVLSGEPTEAPFMLDAWLDAYDEFRAALFMAVHGWYRQATAGLRNALEVMAHAAQFAARNNVNGHRAWREGNAESPKFGNSVDILRRAARVAAIEARLGGAGLFGGNPAGVMRSIYSDVCRYAHSQPGHTNVDIWKSNGPVFIPKAFTQFWLDFCDVLLACYVLLKIGYPTLTLPDVVDGIAGNGGAAWHGLAEAAVAAYFPDWQPNQTEDDR